MKIVMLQTAEDSHSYVTTEEDGTPVVKQDVRKFYEGQEYDETNGGPEWERRAAGLVKLGCAAVV